MQLFFLLSTLLTTPCANAADFGIFGADQQKMVVVGWSSDESHVAIRQFDIRSAKYNAANPGSATGCPGYTLPNGSPFDGTEQIILFQGNRVKSRVPIRDGRSCTHPDDISSREQTAANFLQGSGIAMGKNSKPVALTGAPGSQGFVFHNNRFKFGGDTELVSGNNHKINARLRSVNSTFKYPFTISSPVPNFTWGLDSVIESPSGNRAILIGFVERDGARALGVVDILKYENGAIAPASQ
jgi:hypothetical protein